VACDDGYIDCGPLVALKQNPPDSRKNIGRRESAPLLSKTSVACVPNSVEDLTDGASPGIYQCMSFSGSVGSQLSAAGSSMAHEESFNDLSMEIGSSHGEYLPMSRITIPKDDSSASTQSAKCGSVETCPLLGTFPRDNVAPSSVSESINLSSLRATQSATVAPSLTSASCRNSRDEDGYLLFQPTVLASAGGDQNSGGSLERLGPPPEIPTSSADYIIPRLPPKQHKTAGLRANSLLLSSRPPIIDRRRGSADNWAAASGGSGPAVPSRENRDPTLAGFSTRPTAERRASRKPNLTVDALASANIACTGEFVIN